MFNSCVHHPCSSSLSSNPLVFLEFTEGLSSSPLLLQLDWLFFSLPSYYLAVFAFPSCCNSGNPHFSAIPSSKSISLWNPTATPYFSSHAKLLARPRGLTPSSSFTASINLSSLPPSHPQESVHPSLPELPFPPRAACSNASNAVHNFHQGARTNLECYTPSGSYNRSWILPWVVVSPALPQFCWP